jgi:hypothetical protein
MTISLKAAAMVVLLPLTLKAQPVQDVRISWTPEQPVQGTLFQIHVTQVSADDAVSGRMAGEPLHFTRKAEIWEALAAAPLDQGSKLDVTIVITRSAVKDTVRVSVPMAKGDYKLEKLTVAPRFGTPPDSAIQARMDREREKALAVSRASHNTPRHWRFRT